MIVQVPSHRQMLSMKQGVTGGGTREKATDKETYNWKKNSLIVCPCK